MVVEDAVAVDVAVAVASCFCHVSFLAQSERPWGPVVTKQSTLDAAEEKQRKYLCTYK